MISVTLIFSGPTGAAAVLCLAAREQGTSGWAAGWLSCAVHCSAGTGEGKSSSQAEACGYGGCMNDFMNL